MAWHKIVKDLHEITDNILEAKFAVYCFQVVFMYLNLVLYLLVTLRLPST